MKVRLLLYPLLWLALICAFSLPSWLPEVMAKDGDSARTLGDSRSSGYFIDRTTADYRSDIAAADNANIDWWGSVPEFWVGGLPNLTITYRAEATAKTATIVAAFYYKDATTINSPRIHRRIVTTSDVTNTAGEFYAPTYTTDTYGANVAKVGVISIEAGSGTPSLMVGSH